MFIKIKSDNPNISFVLCKHPDSIKISKVRQGQAIGWWYNGYNILFKESPDEISYPKYKDQCYDHLCESKYNSPLCVLNLLTEFCRLNKDTTLDIISQHSITFPCRLKERTVKHIEKYLPYISIKPYELWPDNYIITISCHDTFALTIARLEIFLWMSVLDNRENVFIADELVTKIIKLAKRIEAPYFLRYILKCILITRRQWDTLKPELELPGENLDFGSNMESRIRFVQDHLTPSSVIVDIGCGEGRYFFLSKDRMYYAIESDPDVRDIAAKRIKDRDYKNVMLFSSVEEFLTYYTSDLGLCDIIMTEVVEHVPNIDEFMEQVKKINYSRMIITTPNLTFNIHYGLGIDLRHEDHVREWTREECIQYFTKFGQCLDYQIGDIVNNVATTTGIVIC